MKMKPVINHPAYIIYEDGRVWSTKSNNFLKMNTAPNGYQQRYNLDGKNYNVPRLVGMHFLPDFDVTLDVCHRDETLPLNELHHANNLWMGTAKQNIQDCHRKGRARKGWKRDSSGRFVK